MNDAVDVPACKVSQVLEECFLDEIERLSSLLLSVHIEGLHRKGLCTNDMRFFYQGDQDASRGPARNS